MSLNELMTKFTGLRFDFENIIRNSDNPKKLYQEFMWNVPKGLYLNNSDIYVEFKKLINELVSNTSINPDVNEDGVIDELDIEYIKEHIGDTTGLSDINNDGIVDNNDVFIIDSIVGKSLGMYLLKIDCKSDFTNLWDVLPGFIADGMNEKGVAVNINVVPRTSDLPRTTGTHPDDPNFKNLVMKLAPKVVLDYASTAAEGVSVLAHRNIIMPQTESFHFEIHMMISDVNNTYIVEFLNNQMIVISTESELADTTIQELVTDGLIVTKVTDLHAMTNYHVSIDSTGDFKQYSYDGTEYSKYAVGVGRYNTIKRMVEEGKAVEEIMQAIKYTHLYTDPLDSNFAFIDEIGDEAFGITYPMTQQWQEDTELGRMIREQFGAARTVYQESTDKERRDNGTYWQTRHTCIFDLEQSNMKLYTQENYDKSLSVSLAMADEIPNHLDKKKLEDYLHIIHYKEMDMDMIEEFFEKRFVDTYSGCSSVRIGKYHGRNFDWNIDYQADVIVFSDSVETSEGPTYKSFGIIGALPEFTDEFMTNGDYNYFGKTTINSIETKSKMIKPDSIAIIEALPKTNEYEFVKWDDEITDNKREILINKDTTLTAIFKMKEN